MMVLVLGASGATGRRLVHELLARGVCVRIVIRAGSEFPDAMIRHDNLTLLRANFLDLTDDEIAQLVDGCSAVASCLGHTLSLKGIYVHPRRLVTEAVRRVYRAVERNAAETPIRFVLMNSTGNSNRDIPERVSFAQDCVIRLLRLLLPPHVDNEQAADFLRTQVGPADRRFEWSVVRPDALTDHDQVTDYRVFPSPVRSAIFDSGTTSRINVGHFMAELITNDATWNAWRGQMPVIYNAESAAPQHE